MAAPTPNARRILEERYYDDEEDWQGLCTRVARHLASCEPSETQEAIAGTFFEVLYNQRALPNSPTLMNAGRSLGQLSACFVLPVDDDLSSIMDSVKAAALIHQSGGGTGFDFSRLRPEGSPVKSSGGVASGPVSLY